MLKHLLPLLALLGSTLSANAVEEGIEYSYDITPVASTIGPNAEFTISFYGEGLDRVYFDPCCVGWFGAHLERLDAPFDDISAPDLAIETTGPASFRLVPTTPFEASGMCRLVFPRGYFFLEYADGSYGSSHEIERLFSVDMSGLETLDAPGADPAVPVYNLQGIPVDPAALTPGIYITSGRKVMVK